MLYDATVGKRTVRVEIGRRGDTYTVTLDGRALEVDVRDTGHGLFSLLVGGESHEVGLEKRETCYRVVLPEDVFEVELREAARGGAPVRKAAGGMERVSAPMPGKIVRLAVEAGQEVTAGQPVVVMEAMKMENEIRAPRDGRVHEIAVGAGQAVETGAVLFTLE